MHQYYLIGTAAVLVQASFSNTIGLGSVLIGILIVIGFAWASRKDKRSERWEALYNLADVERKEIQGKLDTALETVKEQATIINKLDALQMPVQIVEMMSKSVERIDSMANSRLERVMKAFTQHEDRATQRHTAAMELMSELVKALTHLTIRIEDNAKGGD